jgi:hypothetical protein
VAWRLGGTAAATLMVKTERTMARRDEERMLGSGLLGSGLLMDWPELLSFLWAIASLCITPNASRSCHHVECSLPSPLRSRGARWLRVLSEYRSDESKVLTCGGQMGHTHRVWERMGTVKASLMSMQLDRSRGDRFR